MWVNPNPFDASAFPDSEFDNLFLKLKSKIESNKKKEERKKLEIEKAETRKKEIEKIDEKR